MNTFVKIKNSHTWARFKRNPIGWIGLTMVLFVVFCAVFAPYLSHYDPVKTNWMNIRKASMPGHLFGTDELGRDIWTRLIYGARASLSVGLISVTLAMLVGVPIGIISGYFGRKTDFIISRLTDAMISIPSLILAIAVSAVLGASLQNVMIAIAVANIPIFIRLARGQTLVISKMEYVQAAHSVGVGHVNILLKYILPNILSTLVIQATLSVANAIIAESSLSFLGLGMQPPAPSWGSMLNIAKQFLEQAPWLAIYPGLAIVVTVLGFNLLGDALNDALDPKQS